MDVLSLKLLWWMIVCALLVGFAVMDGLNLGVCMLLPWVGRDDDERRQALTAAGTAWQGSLAWLLLGCGAVVAAWPLVFRAGLSVYSLSIVVPLTLLAVLLRPLGMAGRLRLRGAAARRWCDRALAVTGWLLALVFGVAFGNLFVGLPFHFDGALHASSSAGLLAPVAGFALWCGLLAASMLALHGAAWLCLRADGAVRFRARVAALGFGILTPVLFLIGGLWINSIDGLRYDGELAGVVAPLAKEVVRQSGAWLGNFVGHPALWLLPSSGVAAALCAAYFGGLGRRLLPWLLSAWTQAAVILTAAAALFPFVLPSSDDAVSSLTLWDSGAAQPAMGALPLVLIGLAPVLLAWSVWLWRTWRVTQGAQRRVVRVNG